MDEIRRLIKSDKTDKTVNVEKQNRHIRDTREYVEGRSYLFDDTDPQELVDEYHGTGEAKFTESGIWKNKEVVSADRTIGVVVNHHTRDETITNCFTIHYSRTGTHIVPTLRKD